MDLTLVSQHSSDIKNRNLMEAINGFGGNNCYLRGITFSSAKFEK
jgi:hypothetical protein